MWLAHSNPNSLHLIEPPWFLNCVLVASQKNYETVLSLVVHPIIIQEQLSDSSRGGRYVGITHFCAWLSVRSRAGKFYGEIITKNDCTWCNLIASGDKRTTPRLIYLLTYYHDRAPVDVLGDRSEMPWWTSHFPRPANKHPHLGYHDCR